MYTFGIKHIFCFFWWKFHVPIILRTIPSPASTTHLPNFAKGPPRRAPSRSQGNGQLHAGDIQGVLVFKVAW